MSTFNQVVPAEGDEAESSAASHRSEETPWFPPKMERRMSARERVEHRSAANRAMSGRLPKFAENSRRSISEKRQSAVAFPSDSSPFSSRLSPARTYNKDKHDFLAPPRQKWSAEPTKIQDNRPSHAFSLTSLQSMLSFSRASASDAVNSTQSVWRSAMGKNGVRYVGHALKTSMEVDTGVRSNVTTLELIKKDRYIVDRVCTKLKRRFSFLANICRCCSKRKAPVREESAAKREEDPTFDFLQALKGQLHHGAEFLSFVRDHNVRFSFFDIFTSESQASKDPSQKSESTIIRVFSSYNHWSEIFLLGITLWTAVLVPFVTAYHDVLQDPDYNGIGFSDATLPQFLMLMDGAIDVSYLLGVLLLLKTSFIDKDSGFEVVEHSELIRHRLKSIDWWADIISCVPWLVIDFIDKANPDSGFYWLVVIKLLRVWRLTFKPARFRVVTNALFEYLFILGAILILGHWVSCLFFRITWGAGTLVTVHLERMNDSEGPPIVRYFLYCFKMGVYLLIGMDRDGYSDYENMLLSIFAPVGSVVQAVVLGRVILLVQRRSALQTQAEETTQKLRQAMVSLHIPPTLQLRIISYFTYQRTHRAGAFTFSELFKGLSEHLLFEMNLFLYHDLVTSTELFKKTPARVVKEIIMVLKDTVYLPGDFICRPGDDGNAMFFIVSGSVSILVSTNYAAARGYAGMQDQRANQDGVGQSVIFDDSFSAVAVNHAGAYFGEISVLTGEKRKAYVRADIFVTLATLYKNDFHTIIKKYPEQLGVLLSHMNMAMLAESAKKQRNKNMGAISGRDYDADEYGSDDGSDALLLSEQHVSDDGQQQSHRRQSRSRTIACTGAMRRSSFSNRGADINSQELPPGYSGQRRWSRTRSFSSANLDVLQGGGSGGVSPGRPVPSSRRSSITNIASYRRSSSMSNLEIAKAVAQDESDTVDAPAHSSTASKNLRKQSQGNILAVANKSEGRKRMSKSTRMTHEDTQEWERKNSVQEAAAHAAAIFASKSNSTRSSLAPSSNDEEKSEASVPTPKPRPPELDMEHTQPHKAQLSPIKEASPSVKSASSSNFRREHLDVDNVDSGPSASVENTKNKVDTVDEKDEGKVVQSAASSNVTETSSNPTPKVVSAPRTVAEISESPADAPASPSTQAERRRSFSSVSQLERIRSLEGTSETKRQSSDEQHNSGLTAGAGDVLHARRSSRSLSTASATNVPRFSRRGSMDSSRRHSYTSRNSIGAQPDDTTTKRRQSTGSIADIFSSLRPSDGSGEGDGIKPSILQIFTSPSIRESKGFAGLFGNAAKIQQATMEFLRSPAAKQIEEAAVTAGLTKGAAQAAALAAARSHAMELISSLAPPVPSVPASSASTPLAAVAEVAASSQKMPGSESVPFNQVKRPDKRGASFKRSITVALAKISNAADKQVDADADKVPVDEKAADDKLAEGENPPAVESSVSAESVPNPMKSVDLDDALKDSVIKDGDDSKEVSAAHVSQENVSRRNSGVSRVSESTQDGGMVVNLMSVDSSSPMKSIKFEGEGRQTDAKAFVELLDIGTQHADDLANLQDGVDALQDIYDERLASIEGVLYDIQTALFQISMRLQDDDENILDHVMDAVEQQQGLDG